MKCSKHDYGYDDLPILGLKQPCTFCYKCWAAYIMNEASGEIASYNVDILEEAIYKLINSNNISKGNKHLETAIEEYRKTKSDY